MGKLLLACGTVLGLVVSPDAAAAQSISAALTGATGRTSDQLTKPFGAVDCRAGIDCTGGSDDAFCLTVRITGIPTDKSQLDFWSGSGCNSTAERMETGSCEHLDVSGTAIDTRSEIDLPIPISALLDCADDGSSDGAHTIFVLATDTAGSTEDVGANYGFFQIELDRTAPSAPSGVTGGTGNTAIPLSWTPPSGEVATYNVYSHGDCEDTELVAGAAPPVSAATVGSSTATSVTLNGEDDLGLALGEEASVAVTAVDMAANESVLSEVVCIVRVPTEGFWARYQLAGGAADTCSAGAAGVPGGSVRGASLARACLLAAALLLVRRRQPR